MQILSLDIIGTHLQISIDTPHSCDEVFSDIRIRLEDFEQKYSRFIDGNWLDDLNTHRSAILDTDTQKMLTYMLDIARETDGYFDPTVSKRLTELGYGKKMVNGKSGIVNGKKYGDYRNIEINGDRVILHGDILLEFGGVGKGYMIDVIRDILDIYPRFLINFGGDIYGRGRWTVGLESPFASDEVIGTIVLTDHYLACSAGTRRAWGTHHHLIDPHTGESSREVVASYIEGVSGMIADAYATTLCVMPWELAIATLERTPEISGVVVRYDGTIFQKEGSRSELF